MTIAARPVAFAFLRSEGPPFEVGRAHGAAFGEQIAGSLELYRAQFAQVAGVEWSAALEVAERAGENIRSLDRDLAEELDGIAAGAETDPRGILAINVRTGVLREREPGVPSESDAECTTAVCLPETTAEGHTLLAQNWDQRLRCQPNTVVIEQHIAGQPALLFLTEAGILFRHGMNDAGLGVAGNALRSDREVRGTAGVPAPVARRRALRHDHLEAAVKEVVDAPRSHSVNHLLADAVGAAVDLEAIPGEVYTVSPENGVLVHSNHFLNADACASLIDRTPDSHPSTLYRDVRVRDALTSRRGEIAVGSVQEALQDHHGFPDAVCKHAEDPDAADAGITVSSTVMDLTDRRTWITPGPPCTGTYTEYAFS